MATILADFWLPSDLSPEEFQRRFSHPRALLIFEIGFGMGDSLIEMASLNPDQQFIGVEVYKPGVGRTLHNIEQAQLSNCHLFCDDAIDILNLCIPNHSLDRVQIFFPDPWPKTRHQKRRLINNHFLQLIHEKLKPSGLLHIATDWQPYAHSTLHLLKHNKNFTNCSIRDDGFTPRPDYRPLTKFEKRGRSLGHGIWDIHFIANSGRD